MITLLSRPVEGAKRLISFLGRGDARTDKAGWQFVLGEREYLVAVKSTEGVLAPDHLHYIAEILPYEGISRRTGRSTPKRKTV